MSNSSGLSAPPSSEDEKPKPKSKGKEKATLKLVNGKLGGFKKKKASPPPSSPEPDQVDLGREASPPHEYVLADNRDIAVIVMFRSRFDAAFAKTVPHLGPQDIEAGVVSSEPSEGVENLLCALLGLVLNRKKNPERGHYNRALEECLSSQRSQWPYSWAGRNPIAGGKTFQAFSPVEKLDLLRTLIHWSLITSEAIGNIVKDSYKQSRKDDDINQPLSVQPWGTDTRKRKFYLIEGQVDAPFRIYRESQPKAPQYSWFSVAGTIEEAQRVARDLRAERGQAAHRLAARITNAIPMFEEREDKRRRREYRRAQKERFTRPEPGFSLYEGRTRGKRMRYTYDDEDIYGTDENRQSSRQSRTETPVDAPRFTASGRQVRSMHGRSYGDTVVDGGGPSTRASSNLGDDDDSEGPVRRPGVEDRSRRAARRGPSRLRAGSHINGYNSIDELANESDAVSSANDWEGDDQDFEGKFDEEEEEDADMSDVGSEDSFGEQKSLVVKLKGGAKLRESLKNHQNASLPIKHEANDANGFSGSATSLTAGGGPSSATALTNTATPAPISQPNVQPQPFIASIQPSKPHIPHAMQPSAAGAARPTDTDKETSRSDASTLRLPLNAQSSVPPQHSDPLQQPVPKHHPPLNHSQQHALPFSPSPWPSQPPDAPSVPQPQPTFSPYLHPQPPSG